jgi:hypothetical protein
LSRGAAAKPGWTVLLYFAPCPSQEFGPTYGCSYFGDGNTPRVYVEPGYPRATRKFTFQHEIGHLVCQCADEKRADRYAACHVPRKVLLEARHQGVRTGKCR